MRCIGYYTRGRRNIHSRDRRMGHMVAEEVWSHGVEPGPGKNLIQIPPSVHTQLRQVAVSTTQRSGTTNEHEFTRILLAAKERKKRRAELRFSVLCALCVSVVKKHWVARDSRPLKLRARQYFLYACPCYPINPWSKFGISPSLLCE